MGKHNQRGRIDPELTRRYLLSLLVGASTVAGVSVATSGKLYHLDELEQRLAVPPDHVSTTTVTTAPAATTAPVTTSVAPPATVTPEPAPTTTERPAPTTTKRPAAPAVAPLSEKLAAQPRSGWGLKPAAAASAHLIALTFGIKSVGGFRSTSAIDGSDHPKGLAADFMTSNQKLNRDIGNFALANMKLLRVKYAISLQHYNDGRGWTPMEDRGGATDNHFDHCHVSFY